MTLFAQQKEAIEKLKRYKVGALFMDPGTGKTQTAYELITSTTADFILWLTPFQTKDNLRAELARCGDRLIRIEGIESLSSSSRLFLEIQEQLSAASAAAIVVDESLKIKNWDAVRTKRIIELGKLADYKLILNGTPLSRNLLDLWAQMEFLSPRILGMNLSQFKNTYCEWVRITKRIGQSSYTKEFISDYHNIDHLYSLIGPYVYECTLDIGLSKKYITNTYSLSKEEKDTYQFLKTTYLDNEKLMAMNNNIFLEMTQKMQHSYCCSEEKFDALERILKQRDPSTTIVFCKYIISHEEVGKRFPKVKALTYGKHAFGLNLQHCNTLVFFDKTFDYAQRLQAERRIYRIGQATECTYYDLDCDTGLDRIINRNIAKKVDMLTYFRSVAIEQIRKEL